MEYILAYDIGTSVCKTALVDREGRVAAVAYASYPIHYPKPLWAEQDPQDWWQAIAEGTRQALTTAGLLPGQIACLTFSAPILNVLPLDSHAQPLRPLISWLDGRAVEEARLVMRKLGGPAIFAMIVGSAITGRDLLPKYLWLKRHEPEVYRQAAALVDACGYLLWKATGRLVYEWSAASVTGLFNFKRKTWDATLMRFFGLDPAKFPELVTSQEKVGGLIPQAAAELGLLPGTPVIAGAGDGMTAPVGSGAVLEGDGYLSLGTSGLVSVTTSKRLVGKGGIASLQSADADKLVLITESETAGECLKWAARELYQAPPEGPTFSMMDVQVAAERPGSGGLIFTPWLCGERSPVSDERVRAAFVNLTASHTRSQMLRAIYEGVAYNIRWILDLFEAHYGLRPNPLRVVGGGAKGAPWMQIISDVTGRELEVIANPQDSMALGAALIAMVGLGIYPSLEATRPLVPVGATVKPDPAKKPVYDKLYSAYRKIYPALRAIYRKLNQPGYLECQAGG